MSTYPEEYRKMKYKLIKHNTDEQMNWDSNDDTRAHLTVGAVYDAEVEAHKWHTKLVIGSKKYNAVCFIEARNLKI